MENLGKYTKWIIFQSKNDVNLIIFVEKVWKILKNIGK